MNCSRTMGCIATAVYAMFKITCISLAAYTIICLFQEYFSNDDVSYVTYQKFNERKQDVYPAFSICLYSLAGKLYKQEVNFLNLKGAESEYVYSDMVRGYTNITNEFMEVEFDDVTIDFLTDVLLWFHTKEKDGKYTNLWSYKWNNSLETPFYKTYQDPSRLCFTKHAPHMKDMFLKEDVIELNGTKVFETNLMKMRIYIHQDGQVVRRLGKFVHEFEAEDFEKNQFHPGINKVHINLNQVEILRKRPNAVTECNPALLDDDKEYRNAVMQSMGCFPTYWKSFVQGSSVASTGLNFPMCAHQSEYEMILKHYLPENKVENATKLYPQPCTSMTTDVTITKLFKSTLHKDRLRLEVYYNQETYREYINKEAVDLHDLWSRIGGLIGMFLGFSLLQVTPNNS